MKLEHSRTFKWREQAKIAYEASLFAGGVVRGVLENPLLAIAEVLDIVGALLQVILIATIHECAPRRAKNLASLGECLAPANRIAYDQICATVRAQLVDSLALVVPAAAGTWATARRWIALSARPDERFLTRAIDRV